MFLQIWCRFLLVNLIGLFCMWWSCFFSTTVHCVYAPWPKPTPPPPLKKRKKEKKKKTKSVVEEHWWWGGTGAGAGAGMLMGPAEWCRQGGGDVYGVRTRKTRREGVSPHLLRGCGACRARESYWQLTEQFGLMERLKLLRVWNKKNKTLI